MIFDGIELVAAVGLEGMPGGQEEQRVQRGGRALAGAAFRARWRCRCQWGGWFCPHARCRGQGGEVPAHRAAWCWRRCLELIRGSTFS